MKFKNKKDLKDSLIFFYRCGFKNVKLTFSKDGSWCCSNDHQRSTTLLNMTDSIETTNHIMDTDIGFDFGINITISRWFPENSENDDLSGLNTLEKDINLSLKKESFKE